MRASAGEGVDGVDGTEEDRAGRNESRGVAELEDVEAFFIVEARLPHTQRVIKGQHLYRGNSTDSTD